MTAGRTDRHRERRTTVDEDCDMDEYEAMIMDLEDEDYEDDGSDLLGF